MFLLFTPKNHFGSQTLSVGKSEPTLVTYVRPSDTNILRPRERAAETWAAVLGKVKVNDMSSMLTSPRWWFQPIWKISVKLDHFPRVRGENKQCLKPPPGRIHVLSCCDWLFFGASLKKSTMFQFFGWWNRTFTSPFFLNGGTSRIPTNHPCADPIFFDRYADIWKSRCWKPQKLDLQFTKSKWYCWWLKSGVHQLICSRYPSIHIGFYTSQVVQEFWTINSMLSFTGHPFGNLEVGF